MCLRFALGGLREGSASTAVPWVDVHILLTFIVYTRTITKRRESGGNKPALRSERDVCGSLLSDQRDFLACENEK